MLKVKVKSLSQVQLFGILWTVAYQAPPSMGFSMQKYWSGLPFQYSGLENFMDCIVHGVAKSRTRLSNFHFHFLSFLSVTALAYDLILAELEGRQHSVLQALSLSGKQYIVCIVRTFSSCS